MNEPLTPPSPEVQAEQDTRDMEFFWSQVVDKETLSRLSSWDKRSMSEASLWLSLGTPDIKADLETKDKLKYEEFSDWFPKSANEAFTATHFGFARKSFNTIKSYWSGARDDIDALSRGIRAEGADVRLIRSNHQILYAIADNLMAREAWVNGQWPRKNGEEHKTRQRYWRGQMLAAGEFAGDEVILSLFAQVFSEAVARDGYWTIEFQIMPAAAGRIATSGAVEKPEERSPEEPEYEPASTLQGEDKYLDMMPGEERTRLKNRRKEFSRRWEQLDHAGMPQAEKMATIWREFPELKPAEVAYAEELRDLAIKSAKAKSKTGSSTRKAPIRYASPRDTGPPRHIAEDVRRGQGLID